jgi:hypothetical protein
MLGNGKIGKVRLRNARPGKARTDCDLLGWARLGWARLGWARLG